MSSPCLLSFSPSSASRCDFRDIARPYNSLLKRVHFLFSMKMPVSIKNALSTDCPPQPQHPTVDVPSPIRFPSHTRVCPSRMHVPPRTPSSPPRVRRLSTLQANSCSVCIAYSLLNTLVCINKNDGEAYHSDGRRVDSKIPMLDPLYESSRQLDIERSERGGEWDGWIS